MDELHDRFHRLDRVATPDLWNEAVGRAAALEGTRPRGFIPMMALIATALLMAALVGAVAVGSWVNRPGPNPLTVNYSNGVLAALGGCGRIVGIDPQTSEASELVSASDDVACNEVTSVAWSSGGRWLAYTVARSDLGLERPDAEVWVRDTRSGSETRVQSCGGCYDVDISPDGSLVAYTEWSQEGGGHELVVARADEAAVYRVPFFGFPGRPQFSPDGGAVAIPVRYATSGLHVLDVRSLDETATPAMRVLYGPVASSNVSWSPDGQWLAFDKEAEGGWMEIWAVRADGTDARRLASGRQPMGPGYPVWSADSSTVAYISGAEKESPPGWLLELWTATLDGEANQVYQSPCCVWDYAPPAWSPDGEWIAFGIAAGEDESEGVSVSGLFLVRPDGSDLQHLSAFGASPAWQPLVDDR